VTPSEFTIERSSTIDAPARAIYPHLIDFHAWKAWSPWEGLDPELKRDYSGADRGVGARYAWEGNRKAGRGAMEITDVSEPSKVTLRIDFEKPMKTTNTTVFELAEAGGATTVRWAMSGTQGLGGKIFSAVFNMDKVVGKDFEKGLAALGEVVEQGPSPAA